MIFFFTRSYYIIQYIYILPSWSCIHLNIKIMFWTKFTSLFLNTMKQKLNCWIQFLLCFSSQFRHSVTYCNTLKSNESISEQKNRTFDRWLWWKSSICQKAQIKSPSFCLKSKYRINTEPIQVKESSKLNGLHLLKSKINSPVPHGFMK